MNGSFRKSEKGAGLVLLQSCAELSVRAANQRRAASSPPRQHLGAHGAVRPLPRARRRKTQTFRFITGEFQRELLWHSGEIFILKKSVVLRAKFSLEDQECRQCEWQLLTLEPALQISLRVSFQLLIGCVSACFFSTCKGAVIAVLFSNWHHLFHTSYFDYKTLVGLCWRNLEKWYTCFHRFKRDFPFFKFDL